MSARRLRDKDFFNAVIWSPTQKVVFDRRCGRVFEDATNDERKRRGLPVPWKVEMLSKEVLEPPIF